MRKNTTISFEYNNLVVQRGILLIKGGIYFTVYSPGEITTWFKQSDNNKYSVNNRIKCPKIPEFDEYLESTKESTYKIPCCLNKHELDTIFSIQCKDFELMYMRDQSGIELKGVVLCSLSYFNIKLEDTTELNKILFVIYDGTKISLWESECVRNIKGLSMIYPCIIREIYIYTISNNPDLDKYIGEQSFVKILDKIEYFKLSEQDQKKVIELSQIKNKNILDYKITKLTNYLRNENLLEDIINLSESVGDINSVKISYNLLDLLKLNHK